MFTFVARPRVSGISGYVVSGQSIFLNILDFIVFFSRCWVKGHGVQPSDVKVSEIIYHGRGPVMPVVFRSFRLVSQGFGSGGSEGCSNCRKPAPAITCRHTSNKNLSDPISTGYRGLSNGIVLVDGFLNTTLVFFILFPVPSNSMLRIHIRVPIPMRDTRGFLRILIHIDPY